MEYLASGDIGMRQHKEDAREERRVVTGKGSVVRYLKDGTVSLLYANGNTSYTNKQGALITVNNKGLRTIKFNGKFQEYDQIPCAAKEDL